ncbi:Short-chain dehydrogenase/reductase [Parasponia andersonii]|uniref:Short-chain dehydrogenase/reductase n=1 Tax=Parasponia andersonii TaxID=3476 RepID=A0A2P5B9A5_PARAD|nr:Short-chain dehydrogenase/reductase [Parasponia andersonii]
MASQVSSDHLEPWLDLEGKVVMVTGASSGLGREFCLDLAKAGCRVVAAARRVDRLKSLCDEINSLASSTPSSSSSLSVVEGSGSVRAVGVELDVCADGATIEKSVQRAWEAFGRIDALAPGLFTTVAPVSPAVGTCVMDGPYCLDGHSVHSNVKSPLELSEDEWSNVMKTNLTGTWLVSKYICIRMRDGGRGGSVINISSIAGLSRGQLPGATAYASSKAGLNSLTRVMALELGVYKIRVNAISPGLFKSEITQGLMQKDWLSNVAAKTVPLRTFGTSDPALTSLVRYLIHDSSGYVSGNVFIVDAGATLPGVPIFSSL